MKRAARRLVLAAACGLALAGLAMPAAALGQGEAWTTYHRDAARTGFDPDSSVPVPFGSAWRSPALDGKVYGEPLVYGSRVYVATENNSVYALDAATGAVLWHQNAGAPVPASALPCGNIFPTVGITSTPVIDPATNAIYAVADVYNGGAQHVLVGFDLASGSPLLSRGVDAPFSLPTDQLQRAALALSGDEVVIGYGGNDGDCNAYHGWVVATAVDGPGTFYWQAAPPPSHGGAVWGGGDGPSVDAGGYSYATTGNGYSFDPSKYDYGDSIVKLDQQMHPVDSFAPTSWASDNQADADLGSSGALLLPDGTLFQSGKNGMGYLVSSAHLGGIGGELNPPTSACANFGGNAFAGGVIYVACLDGVRAFAYDAAAHTFSARWHGPGDANGSPIVAAGLVWVVSYADAGAAHLYGLNPSSGAVAIDQPLPATAGVHFVSPSAAGGRLFVATGQTVSAFVIAQPPSPSASPPPVVATPPTLRALRALLARVIGRHLHVRRGRVRLRLACPAAALNACVGTVAIRVVVVRASADSNRRARRRRLRITLARARFSVPAGRTRTVRLRLTRAGRARLRGRRKPLRVTIAIMQSAAGKSVSGSTPGTLAPR